MLIFYNNNACFYTRFTFRKHLVTLFQQDANRCTFGSKSTTGYKQIRSVMAMSTEYIYKGLYSSYYGWTAEYVSHTYSVFRLFYYLSLYFVNCIIVITLKDIFMILPYKRNNLIYSAILIKLLLCSLHQILLNV